MTTLPNTPSEWSDPVKTGLSDVFGRGGKLTFLALAVFGVWAAFAPLDSAVVAHGTMVAKGENKRLQHRSGGVVREIFAVEGDVLKAGDMIAELDPGVDQAQLSRLRAVYAKALAQKTRLEAEKGFFADEQRQKVMQAPGMRGSVGTGVDTDAVTSSFELKSEESPVGKALVVEQQREYEKGREAVLSELEAVRERAEALTRQQTGLAERAERVKRQVDLLREQRSAVADLVKADHISKQQLWDIESRLLDAEAQYGQLRSDHDALNNSIREAEAQYEQARSTDERRTSEGLTEVLASIAELADQVKAAETALTDTIVRAPADGTLVHSKLTTVGGVVAPGDIFGEIVPKGTQLQMQARVSPQDISDVHIGQAAKAQITALNARLYDALPAKVVYIAADASRDERTGETFFVVRADLDAFQPGSDVGTILTPGMAGQLSVEGPSRTFLSYLARPLADSFSRSFKEQR